jgi:transposase
MLTQGEDVEVHALASRGWSVSAIARHLGRDRKTVRAYLTGQRQPGRRPAAKPDPLRRSPVIWPHGSPTTRICGRRRCSTRWCRWATGCRM